MFKNMDFSDYQFRASQSFLIKAGTIGLTDIQNDELTSLVTRKSQFSLGELDDKGKPVKKLTPSQEQKVLDWSKKQKEKALPKTMQSELKKIFRSETFKRNFVFTNDYIQKGLKEEEEAISVLQEYRDKVLGINTFFLKNEERFFNDYFSGLPDLFDSIDSKKRKEGFDTKCSWNLKSFPFKDDELDPRYECQNQVYMDLTGLDKWTTAYVLVNASEDLVFKEKQKWYYALKHLGQFPDEEGSPYYDEYIKKCREIELMMIFDYERFVEKNPYHQMTIEKDEWFGMDYDIPLDHRVVEKVSIYDQKFIDNLKERVIIGRDYMNNLKK